MAGGGAYAWDKNTSARLGTKDAGGLMRGGCEGGVFARHYGNLIKLYIAQVTGYIIYFPRYYCHKTLDAWCLKYKAVTEILLHSRFLLS